MKPRLLAYYQGLIERLGPLGRCEVQHAARRRAMHRRADVRPRGRRICHPQDRLRRTVCARRAGPAAHGGYAEAVLRGSLDCARQSPERRRVAPCVAIGGRGRRKRIHRTRTLVGSAARCVARRAARAGPASEATHAPWVNAGRRGMKPGWRMVRYDGRAGLAAPRGRLAAPACRDPGPWRFHHSFEAHAGFFDHFLPPDREPVFFALSDGQEVRAICPGGAAAREGIAPNA